MKRLALFDLDGTLTHGDTFIRFLRYACGDVRYFAGMSLMSPYLISYKLGLYPNWKAKEQVLRHFFGGMEKALLREKGKMFATEVLPGMLRKEAIDKLMLHKNAGDEVSIVSASCEEWVRPWADNLGIGAICTRMEYVNDRVSGKLAGKNNYGPEKESRIMQEINLTDFDEIHAYGDSRGDSEMLALSTHPYFRKF